jgi:AraC-like DNA-binding protein
MRPFVRAASLTGYASLAGSLGLDAAALARHAGLDLADLDVADRWIPAAPAVRLLELSARRSGCQDFAVRLSELRGLGALGPLSVALRDEPDLRSVLDLLIRYEAVYTGVVDLRLVEDAGRTTVEVWMNFGEPLPLRQATDLTIAVLAGTLRRLLGSSWHPEVACFAHGPPADLAAFVRVFGADLRFDQRFTGLVLSAGQLDAPVVTADASVRPYSRQFLRTAVPQPRATTADQASSVVEALLPLGTCTVEDVSRHLALPSRTLQRLLAEEGSSFSTVVQDTRARMAERYLADDRHSVTEVSQMLGFSAPSGLSRWFRQRFGTTPSHWRQTARDGRILPVESGVPVPRSPTV